MIRNFLFTAGAVLAMAQPSAALDLEAMSDAERTQFREEVRAYLLDNPEVIMEAVAVLEERKQAAQQSTDDDLVAVNEDALYNDGFSFVGGNPDGDITLVEFLDYRCGYCKRAHPAVAELVAADGNIRLIVKEFPILGDQSVLASRFAIAVMQLHGSEKYKSVSDALMSLRGDMNEAALARVAGEFGLDADAILTRMDSEGVTRVISETRLLGQRMQISGTPSFVLGGQMIRGFVPLEAMQQAVSEAREG